MDNQTLLYIGAGVVVLALVSNLGKGSSSTVIRGGTDPTAANLALGLAEQQTQRSSVIAGALTQLGVSANETKLGMFKSQTESNVQLNEIAARSALGMRELAVRENLGFQELAVRSQLGNKSLDYSFATERERARYDYNAYIQAIEKDRQLGLADIDVKRYGITRGAEIEAGRTATQNTQNWLNALNPGTIIGNIVKAFVGGG